MAVQAIFPDSIRMRCLCIARTPCLQQIVLKTALGRIERMQDPGLAHAAMSRWLTELGHAVLVAIEDVYHIVLVRPQSLKARA